MADVLLHLNQKLMDAFGEIEVDLTREPREITLDIDEKEVDLLAVKLKLLGYPLVGENMGFVDSTSAKAKSFVSCAIGKMNA